MAFSKHSLSNFLKSAALVLAVTFAQGFSAEAGSLDQLFSCKGRKAAGTESCPLTLGEITSHDPLRVTATPFKDINRVGTESVTGADFAIDPILDESSHQREDADESFFRITATPANGKLRRKVVGYLRLTKNPKARPTVYLYPANKGSGWNDYHGFISMHEPLFGAALVWIRKAVGGGVQSSKGLLVKAPKGGFRILLAPADGSPISDLGSGVEIQQDSAYRGDSSRLSIKTGHEKELAAFEPLYLALPMILRKHGKELKEPKDLHWAGSIVLPNLVDESGKALKRKPMSPPKAIDPVMPVGSAPAGGRTAGSSE